MRRQRTIWEKVIIAIRNIITVVGVGAFILDFANDYRFTTFTIKIVVLGVFIWIFFKADEIVSREMFDDKFNAIMKERSCIRNVLKYEEYQSKNNFIVWLDEDFNVFISIDDFYVVKISRDKFVGLDNKNKIDEFDQYLANYLSNSLNKNLNKTATETLLEITISNYLNHLV